MRFVKPLDLDLIRTLAEDHDALVTVEENVVAGGAGSGVAEALAAQGIVIPILHLGLPDRFVDHGDPPWRWYLMTDLDRKPDGYPWESVWCEAGNVFLIEK